MSLCCQIAELGPPAELAARDGSQFRQMLDQAGISSVTKPSALPPLARHDTEPDLGDTPATTRVTFNIAGAASDVTDTTSDVSTPDVGDNGSEAQDGCSDGEVLIAGGDSDGEGYVNEVTRL